MESPCNPVAIARKEHFKYVSLCEARTGTWSFTDPMPVSPWLAAHHIAIGWVISGKTDTAMSSERSTSAATVLPEFSTTFSAVRFGSFRMPAAIIQDTDSLEISLLLPADIASRDGVIFDALQPTTGFIASPGIVVTSVYLSGMLERRDKTILGMGVDSSCVLVVNALGLIVYYAL